MSQPLSRTAAAREARRQITIGAFGARQYVVYSPACWSEPDGPNTQSHPRDWWQTKAYCTRLRAAYALHLMGTQKDAWPEVEVAFDEGYRDLESLVRHVHKYLTRND